MTTKTKNTATKILRRLDAIERNLNRVYLTYGVAARCSDEHTAAATAIRNLESERAMLETTLVANKTR